jgi:hypothetical protein
VNHFRNLDFAESRVEFPALKESSEDLIILFDKNSVWGYGNSENENLGGKRMMRRIAFSILFVLFFAGIVPQDVQADQQWISDILMNPSRYWNTRVTVVGQVQTVTANPPGTTRGEYTVMDESGDSVLSVRTNDLPPVGRTYAVTGMIMRDPANADVTYMKEVKRTSPGMPDTMKLLLIGGGVLFLGLLIIFILLLVRPKTAPVPQAAVRPTPPPMPADLDKTTRIAPAPGSAPGVDKTQVFMSLGADIIVERGADKGKEFTLHKLATTLGRPGSRKNDIELSDDTVSKEQASIFYDNTTKKFSISNESTTNPTKVKGQLFTGSAPLENGDTVEMGRSVLRFKQD